MNNDTFQWDDLLACEWAGYLEEQIKVKGVQEIPSILANFKQSKTPKKENGLIGVGIKGNVVDYTNSASIRITDGKVTAIAMDGIIFLPEKTSITPGQPKKERIEVTLGGIHEDIGGTKYAICFSRHIGREKFPAIKSSVERVLNDEGFANLVVGGIDISPMLKEAEEKAFNAAREHWGGNVIARMQYPTFQDYLNSKK